MIGCDGSYVLQALRFYHKQLISAPRQHSEVVLLRFILDAVSNILCTWNGMTEAVSKVARLLLLNTQENSYMFDLASSIRRCLNPSDAEARAALVRDSRADHRDTLNNKRTALTELLAEGRMLEMSLRSAS